MKKPSGQRGESKKPAAVPRRKRSRLRRRTVKAGALGLAAPVRDSRLHNLKIGDLYRPLKKPVTLRLDADVIAWFKKDGRRYQTRINGALRKVMEREMKGA
ncbi:MAG TPA: BrnA antitoxin family protein [Candidatus Dormibacteraeota bacterium]|nr:BrnA antitoxin family protein [Candidatus Dormibacteraeota bacterium]